MAVSLPGKTSPLLFPAPQDETRIVLLGKTGTGKSRTGCNILDLSHTFPWALQPKSTTTKCEWKTANRFNKKIDVVDTPGIFDTERSNEAIQEEIKKCITLTTPGPHAILLCVHMGKFTLEDIATVEHFLKYFGDELIKYVILVFTRADDWEREQYDLGTNVDITTYIHGLPKGPQKFLEKCNHRYVLWNNRLDGSGMESQVQTLLEKIDEMIKNNNGACYTNEDYEIVEQALQSLLASGSYCSSLSGGNDFDSSFERDHGGPRTERDQVKNSDSFYDTIKTLLGNLKERIKDVYAWLFGDSTA